MSCLEDASVGLVMLVAACGGRPVPTHPVGLSAEEHRRAAAEEERVADTEDATPGAVGVRVGFPVVPNINADSSELGQVEIPATEGVEVAPSESEQGKQLRRHAAGHQRAAAELEAFTDAQCEGVGVAERQKSPLHQRIARVANVNKGVRLVLAAGVDADALLAAARCHHAFARERGHQGGDDCPLFVPDIDIVLEPRGAALRLTSANPGYARALQARAAHLLERDHPDEHPAP